MKPLSTISLVTNDAGVRVETPIYIWEWQRQSDVCSVRDRLGHVILTHQLQPYVAVLPAPQHGTGMCTEVITTEDTLTIHYDAVNDASHLEILLQFHDEYYCLLSLIYHSQRTEDVVAVYYAADDHSGQRHLNGRATYLVVPGAHQAPEQYTLLAAAYHQARYSLGCSGSAGSSNQQPFLPSYCLACFSGIDQVATGEAGQSSGACFGYGAVPMGNPVLEVENGSFSPLLTFRSDLWHCYQGPGIFPLTPPLITAIGDTWYDAMRGYFQALIHERYITPKAVTAVPASAYWPQYDTWGDQIARDCVGANLTQTHLEAIYRDFRASGMQAKLFVIDDLWEEAPGAFSHSVTRLPDFPTFLDRVRADGMEIGLWTAFARCQDFRQYGLEENAVLQRPDGSPFKKPGAGWYIFDPTQPAVQQHLRTRVRDLLNHYHPKLIKLDFGYEIPPLDQAAPHDLAWAGDRLFLKFLEVIVTTVREIDPTVTIEYYALTPLLALYYDQLSFDDMWMSRGNYYDAFNKRAVMASLCGEIGVVPYGSSGYTWESAPPMWLDTPIIGTVGAILPFAEDEADKLASPEHIACYNGIRHLTRSHPYFRVEFLSANLNHPILGPRVASWARLEEGQAVAVVLRPQAGQSFTYQHITVASCDVVVASIDSQPLHQAQAIGIVALGEGWITLLCSGQSGKAYVHCLGGERIEWPLEVSKDGCFRIFLAAHNAHGTPIEYVEVQLESSEA